MRSELTVQKAQVILHALESLPLTLRPASVLAKNAMTIACGLKRSFYDSLYLALAVMADCRLVTADGKLFDAVNNAPPVKKHLLWIEDVPAQVSHRGCCAFRTPPTLSNQQSRSLCLTIISIRYNIPYMKAELLFHRKNIERNGDIVEMMMWKVPPSKDRPHGLKYSLVYIHEGKRAVGYDNAEGRGDHRHYGQKERRYRFTDVDTLVEDFKNDVEKAKRGEL